MLVADGEADELDPPLAVAHLFQASPQPGAGQVIGVYRLLRKLGSGGMGSVYLAQRADKAFQKQLALKLMSGGGSSLMKRFLKEREILANLEHPNITRLIDGGMTADGVPYLVISGLAAPSLATSRPTGVIAPQHEFFATNVASRHRDDSSGRSSQFQCLPPPSTT